MRAFLTKIFAVALSVAGLTPAPVSAGPPATARPRPRLRVEWPSDKARRTVDPPVRRVGAQAPSSDAPPLPGAALPVGDASGPSLGAASPAESGASISLQAALYGAITGNPDLVALRNSNVASPEAVEVARRFPTTLNPTLWLEVRPLVYARDPGKGLNQKDAFMYFSLRQPVELGHQTTHRHAIAKAAYNQQQWTVVQAELLSIVQTYRFFQTAAYRREKLRVADELSAFNDALTLSLNRRLEANQVSAADVVLAEVENEATRQQVEVARQDYAVALADLRNQIGRPETAAAAEPLGEFVLPRDVPPLDEPGLVALALQSRPEIHAARAGVAWAYSAVRLAKADRIPTPVVGPVYQRNENGTQFFGFVYVAPIPVLNNGMPLVRQREADYRRALVVLQQAEQRTVTQVRAAVAKWNAANRLAGQTVGLTRSLGSQVTRMERLFEANQADLTKLLQARQRLIQLRNAELDALWQATQAQADLLLALGAPGLISALNQPQPPPAAR